MALPSAYNINYDSSYTDDESLTIAGMKYISEATDSDGLVDGEVLRKYALMIEMREQVLTELQDPQANLLNWLYDIAVDVIDGVGNDYTSDSWTITLTVVKDVV